MIKLSEEKTPLIQVQGSDGDYFYTAVPVSHKELDDLIGRLMQMCDLIGDVQQRKALKDTIKRITREWLDSRYENLGYDRWQGTRPGIRTVKAERYLFLVDDEGNAKNEDIPKGRFPKGTPVK